jgi:hypothetical protein
MSKKAQSMTRFMGQSIIQTASAAGLIGRNSDLDIGDLPGIIKVGSSNPAGIPP